MRKATFIATVIVLVGATVALAAGPVTRTGSEANGIRNPGTCEVQPEGSDMHVKCTAGVGATGSTFVRYRFLRDVGAVRGPATVSGDLRDPEGCAVVRWMAPVRTLRVEVPLSCYIHIRSVTWQQP